MKPYSFDLRFPRDSDIESRVDALFEAGCDDATFAVRCGVPWLAFTREAPTFWDAVNSAVADVRKAGVMDEYWVFSEFER